MPIAGAIGEPSDKADRPESPVPSGFRRNGLICFVARLANSTNYSLRPLLANEASHLKPLRPKRDSCGTCSEVPSSWLRRTLHAQCGKARGPARARARIDRGIRLPPWLSIPTLKGPKSRIENRHRLSG